MLAAFRPYKFTDPRSTTSFAAYGTDTEHRHRVAANPAPKEEVRFGPPM